LPLVLVVEKQQKGLW